MGSSRFLEAEGDVGLRARCPLKGSPTMYETFASTLESSPSWSVHGTGASTMHDPVVSSPRYRFIRGRTLSLRRGTLDIVGEGMAPPGSIAESLGSYQSCNCTSLYPRPG